MTYKLPEPDDCIPGSAYSEYTAATLRNEVAKATAIFDYAVNFVVGTGRSYTCTTEGWTMVDSKHYSDAIAAAEKRGERVNQGLLTKDDVRKAGGVVHGDGNIFFTNIDQLNAAIAAATKEQT